MTPNLNIQPDIKVSLKQTFGIDSEMEVEAFSKKNEYVPEIDKSYKFDRDTTLAIISGFAFNKRVLVQGYHGTGKSTHIEQIAARLNWPCIRVNLDSHVSRIDLIGKDAIVLKEGKQVTQFNEGILPWSIQNPVALVFDEYDAGRPDVMFVIQRVLEAEGNFTLLDKNKVIKPQKAKNNNGIIIPVLILVSLIIIFQVYTASDSSGDTKETSSETKPNKPNKNEYVIPKVEKKITLDKKQPIAKLYDRPENGHSPYNKYFGKGVYDNSSSNYFLIKNSNATDAVVLLVDAFSRKKIRNEYIRKGSNFKMTSVPRGTYYLQWVSGNNWSPYLVKGDLVGGFQNDMSFTKTRDRNDWMKVDDLQGWTVTLYSVVGGDVASEKISSDDFLK